MLKLQKAGYSYQEIANTMGMKLEAVRKSLYRCREKLKLLKEWLNCINENHMKNFTNSLMIAYLEGQTSKQQSKEIQAYVARYPYYEDILCGLKQLLAANSKEEVMEQLHQQKEAARQQLFNKTVIA